MSNVIQMNKKADPAAMYAAIPNKAPERDLWSPQAIALYEALAMMPPADRDAAIASIADPMLGPSYEVWLATQ